MAIIYRTTGAWGAGLGSPLSAAQVDGNFWDLDQRVSDLETNGVQPNNIANIQLIGSQLTITLEDATVFGPFTVPIAMLHWRGDWVADEEYNELDLIFVSGSGTYLVLRDHTSDPYEFDPAAQDGGGNPLYFLLFAVPNFDPSTFNLGDLGNVFVEDPNDGDLLVFSSDHWEAAPNIHFFPVYLPGAIPDSQVLFRWVANADFYIDSLDTSYGYVPTPPTDAVDLELHKNGVQVGTFSFLTSGNLSDNFLSGGTEQWNATDTLEIVSPSNAVADGLADVSLSIVLNRGIGV